MRFLLHSAEAESEREIYTLQLYTLVNGQWRSASRCDAGIALLFGKLYRLNAFFVCAQLPLKEEYKVMRGVKERGLSIFEF